MPLFQIESKCESILWKWVWFTWKWNCRRNSFSYKWFRPMTRFDTEAKGNSVMAYLAIVWGENLWVRSFCHTLVSNIAYITCQARARNASACAFVIGQNEIETFWVLLSFLNRPLVAGLQLGFQHFFHLQCFTSFTLFLHWNKQVSTKNTKNIINK